MKKLRYLILCTFTIWGMHACNNPRSNDAVSMAKKANESKDTTEYIDIRGPGAEFPAIATQPYSDSDFAVNATDRNLLEIELGKIALINSSNQEVKKFGQILIDDHSRANDELITLAKEKDIVLPPTPSRKNLKRIEDFSNEKGSEFDKKYIDFMVSNHRSTIRLFENASKNASDVEIRKYASNALPILKNHLETARLLKEKL